MTAIVLAGGKQTSSESYPDLPISLTPVASQPFLYWLTQWIKAQGFKQVVFSAGNNAEQLNAWVSHQASSDADTCFDVVGETRPLGTAGAMLLAAKRFPAEYFLVVNGDSLIITDLASHIKKLKNNEDLDGIIIGTNIDNAGRFGNLITDTNNRLIDFKEKQPGNGLINAGVYLFKKRLLEPLKSDKELSLERDCFPKWLEEGKQFEVYQSTGPFIDIGTTESLNKARDLIQPFTASLEAVVE